MNNADNLVFIHYGAEKYNPALVKPVRNYWKKPKGGLWLSPINSKYGWKDWCISEDFYLNDLAKWFKVRLKSINKILLIDSVEDMVKCLPFIKMNGIEIIDFELLVKEGVDGIWLTEKGQYVTRLSYPSNLYGWDCESLLVFNPNCIEEL